MCFEIIDKDDRIRVSLIGSIGVKEATSLRQRLFPRIRNGFSGIVFDLGAVTDMDSSGLGLLLAVQKIGEDFHASVTFHDVPETLRERLLLSGIAI